MIKGGGDCRGRGRGWAGFLEKKSKLRKNKTLIGEEEPFNTCGENIRKRRGGVQVGIRDPR